MYWKKELRQGRKFLENEEHRKALKCFGSALSDCPVSSSKGISKALSYLGLTLRELGREDSATKCWKLAHNLNSHSLASELLEKQKKSFRQKETRENDRLLFFTIQKDKYLGMKRVKRFCSQAENDVVLDLISNYWLELVNRGEINQLSSEKKNIYFREQKIIFPLSSASLLANDDSDSLLRSDSIDELCTCGCRNTVEICMEHRKEEQKANIGDF